MTRQMINNICLLIDSISVFIAILFIGLRIIIDKVFWHRRIKKAMDQYIHIDKEVREIAKKYKRKNK